MVGKDFDIVDRLNEIILLGYELFYVVKDDFPSEFTLTKTSQDLQLNKNTDTS